jgi:hypothetical protein
MSFTLYLHRVEFKTKKRHDDSSVYPEVSTLSLEMFLEFWIADAIATSLAFGSVRKFATGVVEGCVC